MKTYVEQEAYAIEYTTAYGEKLQISWNDLHSSAIGNEWFIDDVDQYPNRNYEYRITYKVVYKDDNGVAILIKNDDPNYPDTRMVWFDFAK